MRFWYLLCQTKKGSGELAEARQSFPAGIHWDVDEDSAKCRPLTLMDMSS